MGGLRNRAGVMGLNMEGPIDRRLAKIAHLVQRNLYGLLYGFHKFH